MSMSDTKAQKTAHYLKWDYCYNFYV